MAFSAGTTALLYLLPLISVSSRFTLATELAGIDVEYNQAVNATPMVLSQSTLSNDATRCVRVPVSGLSRLKLRSYSNAHRITLVPSHEIHERSYKKVQICLHSNSSLGLCHCESDEWESMDNGIWSYAISPYEDKYIDVKFVNNLSGSVTASVKAEFHKWRLLCLAIGFVILLLAPIVSSWVPFYYSSSMAIGVCLVVLIVLFQGMKLLPTGRKNALYTTICGLALGAGSLLLNWLSTFVNSFLANFGFSEEMHNPVLVFLGVGIVLSGAGFGYWLVRKFIVAEDGSVDVGVAQFVKWALRIIAVTFIFQSTLDTLMALAVLVSFLVIYLSFPFMNWDGIRDCTFSGDEIPLGWSSRRLNRRQRQAEFLSRSGTTNSRGAYSGRSPRSVSPWLKSPAREDHTTLKLLKMLYSQTVETIRKILGVISPSNRKATKITPTYYSTFHKTPDRKKFSDEEWKNFTEESTRQAMAEWASSPELTDWMMKNADRIQLHQGDTSEESIGSGSDSTEENIAESSSAGRSLWQRRR